MDKQTIMVKAIPEGSLSGAHRILGFLMIDLDVPEVFKLENMVGEVVFKEEQCDSSLQVGMRQREWKH